MRAQESRDKYTVYAGDVVFNADYMHAYICINDCAYQDIGKHLSLVHVSPTIGLDTSTQMVANAAVVRRKNLEHLMQQTTLHIFHLPEQAFPGLAKHVAKIAEGWAVNDSKEADARGLPAGQAIAFDEAQSEKKAKSTYDVSHLQMMFLEEKHIQLMLKRALSTDKRPVSEGEGFTCAEFIIACYHSAGLETQAKQIKEDIDTGRIKLEEAKSLIQDLIPKCLHVHQRWTKSETLAAQLQTGDFLQTTIVQQNNLWQVEILRESRRRIRKPRDALTATVASADTTTGEPQARQTSDKKKISDRDEDSSQSMKIQMK